MVYKDKTFCSFYKDCKHGKTCHRALTNEVWDSAESLNLLVSQFVSKPDCFEEIDKELNK